MSPSLPRTALPRAALHLPFEAGPFRMAMGLTSATEAEWLEIDSDYPAQIAERCALLDGRRADVLAGLPGTEPMQRELLGLLQSHLLAQHPDWFAVQDGRWTNRLTGAVRPAATDDPLDWIGRTVQEDFCLLDVTGDAPVLVAAVLCFPSRWVLAEKLGKPLGPIHAHVPMYGDRLQRPVDRFLSVLKPGRIAVRLNWSVMDDPALFQQFGKFIEGGGTDITAATAGERMVLRVERQTLRRLPETGAVVFGIHVHVTRLAEVAAVPGEAARLREAVLALPAELVRYKSLGPIRQPLLDYLSAACESASARA